MATTDQKLKLFRGLLTGETAHTGPFYVTVDATRRCNLRCVCCLYHSPISSWTRPVEGDVLDMDPGLFGKLCRELRALGTQSILIEGEGEPFLHPRLFDMIRKAKETGFDVVVFTNGTLLDESAINALIESGLDTLKVSLWATSREDYEKNYPGSDPANFDKVVEGMKLLKRLKAEKSSVLPAVELSYTINRNNFENLADVVDLVESTGCDKLYLAPVNSANGTCSAYLLGRDEEKFVTSTLVAMKKRLNSMPVVHSIDRTLLCYSIGEAVWEKQPCYLGWYFSRIKVDGTVYACPKCDALVGDLSENSFADIWNNHAYRSFREKVITQKGLASMGKSCNCDYCCHAADNAGVHRVFKWFSPLRSVLKRVRP